MECDTLRVIREALVEHKKDSNYSLLGQEYIISARLREYWGDQFLKVVLDDLYDAKAIELVLTLFNTMFR